MRHKYETRGIVLSRSPLGEANAFITLVTPALGLLRVRAQGVRKPDAKLAAALATFAESEVVLMHGREGWRLSGAVLEENWFKRLVRAAPRERAARLLGLLLRLVAGEAQNPVLFMIVRGSLEAFAELPEETHEAVEVLAALRLLAALGLDAGALPGEVPIFSAPLLAEVAKNRAEYVARINRGIEASGL